MTKRRIHCILLQFRALSWMARELNVNKGTLARWLKGERPSERLEGLSSVAEKLAEKLVATRGQCVGDVDGEPARKVIARLRRKGKK